MDSSYNVSYGDTLYAVCLVDLENFEDFGERYSNPLRVVKYVTTSENIIDAQIRAVDDFIEQRFKHASEMTLTALLGVSMAAFEKGIAYTAVPTLNEYVDFEKEVKQFFECTDETTDQIKIKFAELKVDEKLTEFCRILSKLITTVEKAPVY